VVPDPVSVIHVTGLETVHVHPLAVVTENVPVPPVIATLSEAGLTENAQGAACVTVKAFPAIVSVAVRDAVVVLAAIVNVVVPLPVTLVPLVKVTQSTDNERVAVQAQSAVVVTLTLPVPPAAATAWLVLDSVNEHGAAWVMVNGFPAIVSVAVRAAVVIFWAMVNAVVPLPVPLPALVIKTQETGLVAVQPQPAVVVKLTLPVEVVEGADKLLLDSVNEHVPD
jgi:hypothetical protein